MCSHRGALSPGYILFLLQMELNAVCSHEDELSSDYTLDCKNVDT